MSADMHGGQRASRETRRTSQARPDIRTQPTSSQHDMNSSCYPGGIHIRPTMKERAKFRVGLDFHKDNISVGAAELGRALAPLIG